MNTSQHGTPNRVNGLEMKMKKTELVMTGKTYRTTPTSWGDTNIMIDEDVAVENMRDYGFEVNSPDDNENDRPVDVEIAVDADGKFYAIQPAWEKKSYGRRTGEINPALYIECENPANESNGLICVYGRWNEFDDE